MVQGNREEVLVGSKNLRCGSPKIWIVPDPDLAFFKVSGPVPDLDPTYHVTYREHTVFLRRKKIVILCKSTYLWLLTNFFSLIENYFHSQNIFGTNHFCTLRRIHKVSYSCRSGFTTLQRPRSLMQN